MPDIPASWSQALAAVGAIVVVVLILRWTTQVLRDQLHHSELVITRGYDQTDQIVAAGVRLHAEETGPAVVAVVDDELAASEPDAEPASPPPEPAEPLN